MADLLLGKGVQAPRSHGLDPKTADTVLESYGHAPRALGDLWSELNLHGSLVHPHYIWGKAGNDDLHRCVEGVEVV